MPDGLLGVLKLCLLALLYLFFARVLWAVGAELRGPRQPRVPAPVGVPTPPRPAKPSRAERKGTHAQPTHLVVVTGAAQGGPSFAITDELTIGRAAGCAVCIEDGFASQLHARVYRGDKQFVIEDLASTNGTLVNGQPINTATPLVRNDIISIGGTAIEVR